MWALFFAGSGLDSAEHNRMLCSTRTKGGRTPPYKAGAIHVRFHPEILLYLYANTGVLFAGGSDSGDCNRTQKSALQLLTYLKARHNLLTLIIDYDILSAYRYKLFYDLDIDRAHFTENERHYCMDYKTKLSKFNVHTLRSKYHILSNTVTGAVIEMNEDEYALFSECYENLPEETLTTLKELGIIIDDDIDEVEMLRSAYQKSKYLLNVVRLTICPTLECNFACPYCYEKRKSGVMSDSVQHSLLLFIEDILKNRPRCLSICWYGGEPLLCPKIVKELSCKIRELCVKYSVEYECNMITNGYLINEALAKELKEIGCSSIQITIDGPADIHNKRRILRNKGKTFDNVFRGINILDRHEINVRVRMNIDRENISYYGDVRKMFSDNKFVTVYPAPITAESTQSEKQRNKCYLHREYGEYYQQIIKYEDLSSSLNDSFESGIFTCMAENENSYVIDPEGYMYKCLNDVGITEYAVGSLSNSNVYSASAIAKYMGRDPFTEDECKNCVYLPLCYGRCVWEYKDKGTHACPVVKYCYNDLITKGG